MVSGSAVSVSLSSGVPVMHSSWDRSRSGQNFKRAVHQFNFLCPLSAETLTNVLDFKRDAGLWHGVLTVSVVC